MKAAVRELEQRLAQARSAAECLAALLELAALHAAAYRSLDGLRASREALNIARARHDAVATGRALAIATRCHFQRGDYVSAVATGLDAVEALEGHDPGARSSALQAIALALLAVEAPREAEASAERALASAQASNDAASVAAAQDVLGRIRCERGEFRAGRRLFRLAAAGHRLQGDGVAQKKSVAHLAHAYRRQGELDARESRALRARHHWAQALRVYRVALATGRSEADDALILCGAAECHGRLGEAAQARAALTRALALARESRSPAVLAPCLLGESHQLRAAGEIEAAEGAGARARKEAEHLEHAEIRVECLEALARLHDLQGRFEAAADLELQAQALRLERRATFARARAQLLPAWERLSAPHAAPANVRDAA